MIIDLILDRKDGKQYDAKDFYNKVSDYENYEIAEALDNGENVDIQKALNRYIVNNNYNLQICDYINSVNWLDCSCPIKLKHAHGYQCPECYRITK